MTGAVELGRLEKVDVRVGWPGEATHFTPWLARQDNLLLLAETLGIELEPESTERAVGPFSADLVCTSEDERRVVIENQFGRSNHDHLGKLLTYAAGIPSVEYVVWIAETFSEPHRAALDWLNRSTGESAQFFGVEVELWRIGNSLPAPKFNLVSSPNEWMNAGRNIQPGEPSELKRLRLEYWTEFVDFLAARDASIQTAPPTTRHNLNVRLGKAGVHLACNAVTWDEEANESVDGLNRVTVVLAGRNAEPYYEQLLADRDAIERELGVGLYWHSRDATTMRRIYAKRLVDLRDRRSWQDQFAWLHQMLTRFLAVFGPRIDALSAE